jgi:hypothetical protein
MDKQVHPSHAPRPPLDDMAERSAAVTASFRAVYTERGFRGARSGHSDFRRGFRQVRGLRRHGPEPLLLERPIPEPGVFIVQPALRAQNLGKLASCTASRSHAGSTGEPTSRAARERLRHGAAEAVGSPLVDREERLHGLEGAPFPRQWRSLRRPDPSTHLGRHHPTPSGFIRVVRRRRSPGR